VSRENYNETEILRQLKDESLRAVAFSAIVERYSEQIYRHIRRMVFSHEDADDLVQETFIKAWTNIDKFRGDSQISTWLYRIAINETLTFIGKSNGNTISIDTPEGAIADKLESDVFFTGERADALFQEAVNRLPAKQRLTFNMKYYEEMKYEEMSTLLDTSVGALKASYHIAVKKIKDFLKENN
jgi:RNA polymerase sigma-70 factor (ECF subfamily)